MSEYEDAAPETSWDDTAGAVAAELQAKVEISEAPADTKAVVESVPEKYTLAHERLKKSLLLDIDNEKIEVILSDPNHPLYCAKTFEELAALPNTVPIPEAVLKGIREMGYKNLSPIQAKALPLLLKVPAKSEKNPLGKPENVIFQSQAGTGKTAAFAINILSRCKPELKAPQAIVCCHTFPLALQIADVFKQMGKYTGMEVDLVYGEGDRRNVDPATVKPRAEGKITAQIVVGTIGKIEKELTSKNKARQRLSGEHVQICVFDEADELFDKNFHDTTLNVIKALKSEAQLILLSATFPESVINFVHRVTPEPVNSIALPRDEVLLNNIKQMYVVCNSEEEKFEAIEMIYGAVDVGQTFIFMDSRKDAQGLGKRMMAADHKVLVLVGGTMTKEQQEEALKRFKSGEYRVLICTNILSRGIDVVQTTLVVNYDIPTREVLVAKPNVYKSLVDPHMYAQRIGRAGRMGRKGLAITLIDGKNPDDMKHIRQIEKFYGRPITELNLKSQADVQELQKDGSQ